jgi:pyridoxal phosphate enzyme (YggS family)
MGIAENVARVRENIASICRGAGRDPGEITLVAVTKTFGPEMVDAVVAAGVEDIGENRIQEFLSKSDGVRSACRWHLIGPLQRNKATKAIGRFHMVQSIDRVEIARMLDRLGRERGLETRALLQVNTSGEASKHGVAPSEAAAALDEVRRLEHIRIEGLMTIGPLSPEPGDTRRAFRELYELRERLRNASDLPLPQLSMGMSGDYEMAIEEGATIVRLGTVITGPRAAHPAA